MEQEAIIAGLFALALGLVKVVEVSIAMIAKRVSGTKSEKVDKIDRVVVVQLDPEVSRLIRDTHDRVHTLHDIVNVKDHDGVPMVYSSRTMAENVTLIAAAMKDVSSSQERLADVMEKIEDKVDDLKK